MAVAIQGENSSGPVFTIAGQQTTSESESADALNVIIEALGEGGETARQDFANGLPKVKRMSLEESRGLLKLLSHDPRFKDGQPVVQPSYYKRECHNCWCCGLFWVYWIGMLIIAYVGISTGDPYRLIRPIDYNGNTCGGKGLESKTFMYYPQLAKDALKMYQDTEYATACADATAGCFYGVCVEACPQKGTYVCNYETQSAIQAACATDTTAGCVEKRQQENINNGCWVVQMEQKAINMLGRCFPWEDVEVQTSYTCETEKVCEVGSCVLDAGATNERTLSFGDPYTESVTIRTDNCPCGGDGLRSCTADGDPEQRKCSAGEVSMKLQSGCVNGAIKRVQVETARYTEGTDDMTTMFTSFSSWVSQAFADIYNAMSLIIVMGPVAGGVFAFAYILFMTYCAGPIIWIVLIAVQLLFVLLTLFVAWQCGYLETAMVSLGFNVTVTETTQAFLETYSAFGETDAAATETNQTLWVIAFWTTFLLTIFYFFCIIGLRKQIRLATALIKEAGLSISKMKTMLLFPFWTYICKFLFFIYFMIIAMYVVTTSSTVESLSATATATLSTGVDMTTVATLATEVAAEASANEPTVAFNTTAAESNTLVQGLFLYHLFGYFWMVEFISAIGKRLSSLL